MMNNDDLIDYLNSAIEMQLMLPYVYTYPPKGAYQAWDNWEAAVQHWTAVSGQINVYIHIPFCDMKCYFCDLFTVTKEKLDVIERYLNALHREITMMQAYLDTEAITLSSIYFGGGTPALLSTQQLDDIIQHLQRCFNIETGAEISIESTPDAISRHKINELYEMGFNRLSIGVQSFVNEELVAMGRHYGVEVTKQVCQLAAESNIDNVNLDLIYGLPNQAYATWCENLAQALHYQPKTLTLYSMLVRERTPFNKQKTQNSSQFTSNQTRYRWYDRNYELLTSLGYKQHTFVSFAKTGGGCQHEENQFQGLPTLAFGAGARSYAPTIHYTDDNYELRRPNRLTMLRYIDAVEDGRIPVESAATLNVDEQKRQYIILSLLALGVDKQYYRSLFGCDPTHDFASYFNALNQVGLIDFDRKRDYITLTQSGRKYSGLVGQVFASKSVDSLRSRYNPNDYRDVHAIQSAHETT